MRINSSAVVVVGWSLLLGSFNLFAQTPQAEVVRVFILAGQSNMEGKAANKLLEHQANDPATGELFAHLRRDDQWIVRDDVFIKFLQRHGGLTIGYGSPNKTGLELEFGTLMGNHFDEPVLLIKTAWGGHSLYQKFRSPSAGLPAEQRLQQELEQSQKRVTDNNKKNQKNDPLPTIDDIMQPSGSSYRAMLSEVKTTLADYETLFPALRGKQLRLAGFVWFQGFNDMFGDGVPDEYEANMKHFIKDVRRDLDSAELPFVIGLLGQNGSKPAEGAMLQIQQAQWAMNSVPEFKGNVKAIRTDELVDKAAERLFPDWQKHIEAWEKVGSDRPYHYLGSAIWFNRIGHALGDAMLELLPASHK
jgi:alpha-galactosidase